MDYFLETFWNLDQIRGWAETRDPELLRAAALPRYEVPMKTLQIAIRSTHAATAALRDGRDIDGELWAASGWKPKISEFVAPIIVQRYADKHGVPPYEAYLYKELQVHWPLDPAARALGHALRHASESDRTKIVEIVNDHRGDYAGILKDPRLERLTPHLCQRLRRRFSSPEVQGPPNVFVREPFRTIDYLKHLFEAGRLQAFGNLLNDPTALTISAVDWGGLEIGVGGEHQRLSVWMRGKISTSGHGDFENVRVSREEVLREFPVEPPEVEDPQPEAVTDDEIRDFLRAASDRNGSIIAQNAGAELVRKRFPHVCRDRARRLVKQVTGSDKPGPKGPRRRKDDVRSPIADCEVL